MNKEQACLILALFQLQNGNRKLSDFTGIGDCSDCYISELVLDAKHNPSLCRTFHWFMLDGERCVRWDNAQRRSWSFSILDYISFEDKV